MATNKVATYIRINEELYEKLKIIAKNENRSLNAQIENFLIASVATYNEDK